MYMDEGDFRDESDAEFKQYCKKALKELFSSEQCDLMTKEPSRYKNGVPDTELGASLFQGRRQLLWPPPITI